MGVNDLVSVSLSPQNFKSFVRAANETLKAYENTFGALTISDADTAPMRDAAEVERLLKERRAALRPNPSSNEPQAPAKQSRSASRKKVS